MLNRLRYYKAIRKLEVRLAEVQGRIDYYKADLIINGDDNDIAICSAVKLAEYLNEKALLLSNLKYIKSKLR